MNASNDPLVCVAVIGVEFNPFTEGLIDKLIAAEPSNPLGLYLKAWMLKSIAEPESARHSGALAALRQAAAMNHWPNDHSQERILNAQEAAVACGVGLGDSVRLVFANALQHHATPHMLQSLKHVLSEELAEAKSAGREEEIKEIVGLGLITAEGFSRAQPLLMSEFRANEMKLYLLSEVPADVTIGKTGLSAGVQREEAEERIKILTQMQGNKDQMDLMAAASDKVMEQYFGYFMLYGQAEARTFLIDR